MASVCTCYCNNFAPRGRGCKNISFSYFFFFLYKPVNGRTGSIMISTFRCQVAKRRNAASPKSCELLHFTPETTLIRTDMFGKRRTAKVVAENDFHEDINGSNVGRLIFGACVHGRNLPFALFLYFLFATPCSGERLWENRFSKMLHLLG